MPELHEIKDIEEKVILVGVSEQDGDDAEEFFTAVHGQGAYLNGKRLQMSQVDTANSLVLFGSATPSVETMYHAKEGHGPYHAMRHDGYRVHAGEQGPEEDGEAPQQMRTEAGAGTGGSAVTFFAQEGQAGQHGSYL